MIRVRYALRGRRADGAATRPSMTQAPKAPPREAGGRLQRRRQTLWLAVGCLIVYLSGASGYDLLKDDEIRYAEAGRQMLETGNWVIPQFNGAPRYQKPILFYWLQALAQALFGSTPWAARLPTALAGTGVVLVTTHLGRVLWGGRAGLFAGLVLAVSAEMVLLSRMVMTDVVLLLFVQGGIACFCRLQLNGGPHTRGWAWLMYASLALGMLTKGPVALALPAATIATWHVLRGDSWEAVRRLRPLEGIALILLIAAPWYALAHLRSDGEFTRQFLLTENWGRFASAIKPQGVWRQPPLGTIFYVLFLVPMFLPWSGVLPQALRDALRGRIRRVRFEEAAPVFLVCQVLVVFGLFTLSHTKVWTYTLPAFPPLALLIGRWLDQSAAQAPVPGRTALRSALGLLVLASLGMALAGQLLPMSRLPREVRVSDLVGLLRASLWLLAAATLALVLLDRVGSLGLTLAGTAGMMAGWYLVVCLVFVPAFDRVWKRPVRELAAHVRAYPGAVAVTYRWHELGLNFHAGLREVCHWHQDQLGALEALLARERPVFVLAGRAHQRELEARRFYVWGGDARVVYGANIPPRAARRGSPTAGPERSGAAAGADGSAPVAACAREAEP